MYKPKSLKELDKFLKLCVKLDVSEISETHVIFGSSTQAARKPRKAVVVAQKNAEQLALLQERADEIADEISVSHVENPQAFEDAIVAGLLTDGAGSENKETTFNN